MRYFQVVAAIAFLSLDRRSARPQEPWIAPEHGVLAFSTEGGQPGQVVGVVYRPARSLRSARGVALRAAFRTSRDILPGTGHLGVRTVATLWPGPDGMFRGTLIWPDSAVYATFSIESLDGAVVDDNAHRLWHRFMVGPDGRPTLAALRQRTTDLQLANWEQGLEAANVAAHTFPYDAAASLDLLFFQSAILEGSALDSAVGSHRKHLAVLEGKLQEGRGDPESWGALAMYANLLGEAQTTERARREAASGRVQGPYGVAALLALRTRAGDNDPAGALAFLDSLWNAVGPVHPGIVTSALAGARELGDSSTIMLWVGRALRVPPWADNPTFLVRELGSDARFRRVAQEILKGYILRLRNSDGHTRPLTQSEPEARALRSDRAAEAYVLLGELLLADGRPGPAREALMLASAQGWSPVAFRRAAELALAAQDTPTAARLTGRLAADPSTSPAVLDSLRARLGSALNDRDWKRLTDSGASDLRARLLPRSRRTQLPESLSVLDGRGVQRHLSDIVGGTPALVVFWQRWCGAAVMQTPALSRTVAALRQHGFRVLLVDEQPSEESLEYLTKAGLADVRVTDPSRALGRTLNSWATPELFVIDGKGRVRYAYTSLATAGAQLAAIR